MEIKKINIKNKFSQIFSHWSPKIIAEINDYQFKLAKIKGEFIWHDHKDTDEAFIVIKGSMNIKLKDGTVSLDEGEMYVVKKGVKHKPYAEKECMIMLIEPKGVINTGEKIGEFTAPNDTWI